MRLRRRAAGMCEISPIHLENIPSDLTGSWQQWAGFSCDRIKKLLVGGASLGPTVEKRFVGLNLTANYPLSVF